MPVQHRRVPGVLRVAFWNARGVTTQLGEVDHFLRLHDIDAFLVCETFLKSRHKANIPNFYSVRNDRPLRPGGGTIIFIKSSLSSFTEDIATPDLESSSVSINLDGGRSVRLGAVYVPPQIPFNPAALDPLFAGRPAIVAGDLNAKHTAWHSRLICPRGRTLHEYAEDHGYDVHAPFDHTHFPEQANHQSDVIDIAICSRIDPPLNIWTTDDLNSDHRVVIMDFSVSPASSIWKTSTFTDWKAFPKVSADLHGPLTPIHDIRDLELASRHLSKVLSDAQDSCTKATIRTPRCPLTLPRPVLELVRRKNAARRRWQKFARPDDRILYRRLKHQVEEEIRSLRNEKWSSAMDEINDDPNTRQVWSLARKLKSTSRAPAMLLGAAGAASTPADKAEVFADHLAAIFTEPPDTDPRQGVINDTVNNHALPILNPLGFTPATTKEITDLIKAVKSRSAPGDDGIMNTALKRCHKKIIAQLVNIINASLRFGHFPSCWKTAEIVMIVKVHKDPKLPSSYRPISKLSCVGKILERVIKTRLDEFSSDNDIIPSFQHGFVKGLSTTHQLARVCNHIHENFAGGRTTAGVFFDIEKAFDKVWHNGLISKLLLFEFPPHLISIIGSYLEGRSFRVNVQDVLSTVRNIGAGLPQGSVLSPGLYNIFTADIPTPQGIFICQYADDLALFSTSLNKFRARKLLQESVGIFADWLRLWKLKVNAGKSQAIIFSRRPGKRASPARLTLGGAPIPWCTSVRYLGIHLQPRLQWTKHMSSTLAKARGAASALNALFRSKSLRKAIRLRIYRIYILPVLTYAAPVFHDVPRPQIIRFQQLQNRIVRMAMDAPWYMRNTQVVREAEAVPIMDHIEKITTRFFEYAKARDLFDIAPQNPTPGSPADHVMNFQRLRDSLADIVPPVFSLPRPNPPD